MQETENQFLARQASEALTAIGNATQDLRDSALKTIDPRLWTQDHPWSALAVAAVGAFSATSWLVPSKEQQKRAARMEPAQEEQKPKPRETWVRTLIHEAISVAQPAIMSAIAAAISSKAHAAASDGNGQHPANAASNA